MITGILDCCDGGRLELPELLEWRLEYTAGVPCDSFSLVCPWTGGGEGALSKAVEFTARGESGTVFRGVVDEFECRIDGGGGRLFLSGRGKAALLLDNEALPADYLTATAADILRDHVEPYGIQTAGDVALPAVSGFSVASGSSEWQVLYEFTRYYGDVTPRFDREGRLVLSPWADKDALLVDDRVPVTACAYRERRYGVLSEVLVRDRARGAVERVENRPFLALGGRCRRVLTMPGRSNYLAMRYSGGFQIRRAQAQRIRLELTVPQAFFAWPGDLVEVARRDCGYNRTYRVLEAVVEAAGDGEQTRLTLGEPDGLI